MPLVALKLGAASGRRRDRLVITGLVALCVVYVTVNQFLRPHKGPQLHIQSPSRVPQTERTTINLYEPPETLVVYAYFVSTKEHEDNVRFFLEHGIGEGDGCVHVIIVSGSPNELAAPLPALPNNAQYVPHSAACAWAAWGWLLDSGQVELEAFSYFVLLSSGVRGPFVPGYLQGAMHWTYMFTRQLSTEVKAVAPTISCEAAPPGAKYLGPHPRGGVLATDQVGLQTLMYHSRAFGCGPGTTSERAAAAALLAAGQNLACLMMRYRNVDWADERNWGCNGGADPHLEFSYDGGALSPLEVVFVEVDPVALAHSWPTARAADLYTAWLREQGSERHRITGNPWAERPETLKSQRVGYLKARGPACFDYTFYRSKSPDLVALGNEAELWDHFVATGQFERRPFRFQCEDYRVMAAHCLDYEHYEAAVPGAAMLRADRAALWEHFVREGQRAPGYKPRFLCQDVAVQASALP